MAYVIPSPLYRMGEGLLGLPPISCYTMIKNSVNKYTDSLAIVDRDRQEKSLIIFCIFTTFLQLYVTRVPIQVIFKWFVFQRRCSRFLHTCFIKEFAGWASIISTDTL
jgi:hypothetical protein